MSENTRKLLLFALVWFLFVNWGVELMVGTAIMITTCSWFSKTAEVYLARVWVINFFKITAILLTLRWLGLSLNDLASGKFGRRELAYSIAVVLLFFAVEVVYLGENYSPQILREYNHYLRISPNESLALLSLVSEYVYYFLEILGVNLLFAGGLKLGGERPALLLPAFVWGLAHVINVLFNPLITAFLNGVYMMTFALLTYSLVLKTRSLKVPIFVWLLTMAL